MTPNEHPQRLVAFLDGELSAEQEAEYRQHLRGCDACFREMEQHERLLSTLNRAEMPSARGGLWAELRPRLEGRTDGSLRAFAWTAYLTVLLVGLGMGAWAGWSMGDARDAESSPELVAESSLYDLPEESLARSYFSTATELEEDEQ